jgi:nitrate/nitrite-specific signal transduction histidine kinase
MLSEDYGGSAHEIEDIDQRMSHWREERTRLLELLEAADRESKAFEEQVAQVEQQNSNLATLYAAVSGLHSSPSLRTVVSGIEEIVINLVGSEQFAIVRADEGLTPWSLFGVTRAQLQGLSPRSGIMGRAATECRPLIMPGSKAVDSSGVRVCVPLVVDGQARGFLLIFGFLSQKTEIQPLDHELFALVGSQAAVALYSAEILAERGVQPSGQMGQS